MRNEQEARANPAVGLIPAIEWHVVEVRAIGNRTLTVRFADGTAGEVNLSRLVDADDAGVFTALRNAGLFAQVFVDYGAVTWPGEIDLAPDAMYDAIKATGSWTP